MDTNYNNDVLSTIYLENIENYIVINEETYKNIISNIEYNYLLIIFTMSCFVGILCSIRREKNEYLLVENSNPVKGEPV